jgi:DNA replication protein DnaC
MLFRLSNRWLRILAAHRSLLSEFVLGLFDVISTAHERTSLIVTTNLPFESWTEVLGSEGLTGATHDWLTHRYRIIETKGESYRF